MRNRFLTASMALLMTTGAFAQGKKRVAILNFDYSTVQSNVSAIFGTNADIGKGIADLLVEQLVKNGSYTVIERKAIEKIVAEQNFSNSDRSDPNSAAKLGRLLGADAMIMGSIVQFGRDDKNTSVGGNAVGGALGRYGIGGVGRKNSKAVVAISARLVSTDTGEILAVANGKGESARSGTSLIGAGGSGGSGGGGGMDMSSSGFGGTIIGEAVTQAVGGLAGELNANAFRLPTKVVTVNALVADVSGDTLIINTGSRAGIKVGDKYQVRRGGREIRDPATGKVLRRIDSGVGEITITEVDEASAVGKFSGASGPAKVGDIVKNE